MGRTGLGARGAIINLTCFDGKVHAFELSIGRESVVDAARDRRLFRDDPDALPVKVFENGHERRHERGLVSGNSAHEGRVVFFVRCEVAEPASGAIVEEGREKWWEQMRMEGGPGVRL